jgi:hypothetical protein
MVSNVDLAVDFLNVNWPTWVDLVEEPEVLDSHMLSASSHLLGLIALKSTKRSGPPSYCPLQDTPFLGLD